MADIQSAILAVEAERASAGQRRDDAIHRRTELLLEGSASELKAAAAGITDAETDMEQLDALAAALVPKLKAAENAAYEVAQARRRAEAAEAIAAFNEWRNTKYAAAALVIAEGLKLERVAVAALDRLAENVRRDKIPEVLPPPLPPIEPFYTKNDVRTARASIRLPALSPHAEPFAW